MLDHLGAFSEAHWGHVGLWKGPRVVQYDKISCISMQSVSGPFVVIQGHFGSWRAIFGHEGPFLVLFWPLWGPRGPLKRAQGGPTWHIIMLYTHWKCLGSFGVMQWHFEPFWWFWAILGPFGAVLGHFGAPVGTWMAPGCSNMTYIIFINF